MKLTKKKCVEYRQVLKNSYDILTKYQKQKKCDMLLSLLLFMVPLLIYFVYVDEFSIVITALLACMGLLIELYRSDFWEKEISTQTFEETKNKTIIIINDIKKSLLNDIDTLEDNKQKELALLIDNKLANLQSEVAVALFLLSPKLS